MKKVCQHERGWVFFDRVEGFEKTGVGSGLESIEVPAKYYRFHCPTCLDIKDVRVPDGGQNV